MIYVVDLKDLKYPFFNHQAKLTYYFFEKNKLN
jgi:hypothetical protein